eukprot:TRINITY_DN35322_c0_g1_i1.p1 TRINITY_DN35322_c0_g1~~TRINITY_DN35322_c0_g1_i1.p1  ORF type:complete len:114 (-),score=28.98 TRINITY_DN35322_c0_g1_i1:114-455(-)
MCIRDRCIVDLHATPNVRRFHEPEQVRGVDYEWDGFEQERVTEWLRPLENFEYIKVPFLKRLHPGWGEARGTSEQFELFFASGTLPELSLIHISEPTRLLSISYAVFCLKKKK